MFVSGNQFSRFVFHITPKWLKNEPNSDLMKRCVSFELVLKYLYNVDDSENTNGYTKITFTTKISITFFS